MVKWFLVAVALVFVAGVSFAQDRGGGFSSAPGEAGPVKPAWLYVIGINDYQHVQKLETPVSDAKAVRDLLLERFQFDRSRLIERYDREATRANILQDLYDLAARVGRSDSLFIYYAGHGVEDDRLGQGFWIPVDGRAGNIATMISNSDIKMTLAGIPARHIWLVSDSCFSGTLLADRSVAGTIDDRYYREKYRLPSRMILTSGGKEPVADRSGSRDCRSHSVFACYFLKYLRQSSQPYLTPNEVFNGVARTVSVNSDQTPILGTLRQAGDEGGEFVLILKGGGGQDRGAQPAFSPEPSALAPVSQPGTQPGHSPNWEMLDDYGATVGFDGGDAAPAEKQKRWLEFAGKWPAETTYAEQARQRASDWEVLAAAHARADANWEEAKKRVDNTAIPQDVRYRVLRALLEASPQGWERRREVEQALARLSPEGEPSAGDARPVSLPVSVTPGKAGVEWVFSTPANIHFTRSEITVAQYRACVEAGACKPNSYRTVANDKHCNWGQSGRDNHPMNCVNWYGATDFCAWVEGRLPSEDEWHAEASDGGRREYVWGDEKASCDNSVIREGGIGCGRDRTWPVCSKPEGNSVSGLCDMAGNVWEWTSNAERSARILRGGGWLDFNQSNLRTSSRNWQSPSDWINFYGFRCAKE